jgi:hypothetical protein
MAAVLLYKRQSGKANLAKFVEGTDDAVLDSIITSLTTSGNLYNDANTQTVTLGGSALVTANLATGNAVTTVNLGTGTGVTSITIGSNTGAGDVIDIGGAGSVTTIKGDLAVEGTTTSVDSEVVNIADSHLYLNKDYTTAVGESGGLVVNYLPTATTDTEAAGGFTSATTVATTAATAFAAGDFVQVSGAANPANDGLYEVLTHAGNVLTIDSTPVHSFSQTAFTVDATGSSASFTKVTVSALQAGTDGIWEQGAGATAGALTFVDLGAAAGNSLQQAYVQGNTITTSAGEGIFSVTGTETITLTAGAASTWSTSAGALTITSAAAATWSTAAGALTLDGAAGVNIAGNAGEVDVTTTGALDLNSGAGTWDSTAGIALEAATASSFNVTTGPLTLSTTTSGDVTISTTTAGDILLSGAAEIDLTAAGLIDINAGANLDIDVTGSFDMLSTGAFSIDGTGASNVTAATGDLTLSATANSVVVSGGEAAADAVQLTAGNAAGGITTSAGTGGYSIGSGDTAAQTNSLFSGGTGAKANTIGSTASTSSLTLQSGTGSMTFTAGGAFDVNAVGAVTVDGTSIDLTGTAASSFSTTGAGIDLTLDSAAGRVVIDGGEAAADAVRITASNAAGGIDVDAGTGGITLDTTAGFSIDGATASNVTVSGATADLTLGARGATVTLNEVGETTLDGAFTATSLIGALNELINGGAQENSLTETYTTTGRAVGEAVIIDGDSSANTAADASAFATVEGFVGLVATVGTPGTVTTFGTGTALFENGTATPAAGDPIYVSPNVAGRVTGVAPSGNEVIMQIGVLKDDAGLTAGTIGTDETAAVHLQPFQLLNNV